MRQRFGEVIVHPRGQASRAIARHGVRGERHDHEMRPTRHRAQDPRRLETIHLRHLDIHEQQIERNTALNERNGFPRTGRRRHLHTRRPQELTRNERVDFVVFNQQNMPRSAAKQHLCVGLQRRRRDRPFCRADPRQYGVKQGRWRRRLEYQASEIRISDALLGHDVALGADHDELGARGGHQRTHPADDFKTAHLRQAPVH